MAPGNVRRNMSYRKPVPQYEPTPPPSPFPVPPQVLPPLLLDETTDELLSVCRQSIYLLAASLTMSFSKLPHSWSCPQRSEQRLDPRAEQPVELLVPSMFVHTPEHSFTGDRSFNGEDMVCVS